MNHSLRLISLLLLVLSGTAYAQDSTRSQSLPSSLDVLYGQRILNKPSLDGELNNWENVELGQPISSFGIGTTGYYIVNGRHRYLGVLSFSHVIPQKVAIHDSISGRISGFDFNMSLFGYDLFNSVRWFDLIVGCGIATGRFRFFGDSRLEQVNAYFSPYASVAPRFNIGRLSFKFRASYEFDITRSRWRKVWFSTSPKTDLGPMKSTGLSTSFSVGWILE